MFKKNDKFVELLLKMSANNKDAANYIAKFENGNAGSVSSARKVVSELETKGDHLYSDMMRLLHEAFITPIEREDLMALSMALDDVIDEMEHFVSLKEMVAIEDVTTHELKFIENIVAANEMIHGSIEMLASKGIKGVSEKVSKIKDAETNCDRIYRDAIKELFATETDAITVFKRKEMYDLLEKIANNCQTVANVIDSIIMKNA